MKIGYACINQSLECRSSRTFRLASFTPERFRTTVENNLSCLQMILEWNLQHKVSYFRISSDLIPFASHPVCTIAWEDENRATFQKIGEFIRLHSMRVTMHPDQFVLLNSPSEKIFHNSVSELLYHAKVLDLLQLDFSHKIQIHVGGAYGNKSESMKRFIARFKTLPVDIKRRLVIENDDRLYNLQDCLTIFRETDIPIIFDTFHHSLHNTGENLHDAFKLFIATWKETDGFPMADYSSQNMDKRLGAHIQTIDLVDFKNLIAQTKTYDYDIMLEIKDKEVSALKASQVLGI